MSTPAPAQLPAALESQVPLTSAYDALNVPAMAAGGSYLDPTTGVRVWKLTSATFPASTTYWGHDYAEGGNEISLLYSGVRTILVTAPAKWYLIDFTPGVGVGNARELTGAIKPSQDTAFSLSYVTPYHCFVGNTGGVRRFDVRTLAEASGDGWPVASEPSTAKFWLHQSGDDGLFVWMRGTDGSSGIVLYEPGTATVKTYTSSSVNEPKIDRGGRYVNLNTQAPGVTNGLKVWDFNTDTVSAQWTTMGNGLNATGHMASMRRRGMGWNDSGPWPPKYWTADPSSYDSTIVHTGDGAHPSNGHGNGNWYQPSAALDDQWAAFYQGIYADGAGFLAPAGIVLVTPSGQRRLLVHHYNIDQTYERLPFVKFSPDGMYVMFTSDMNGQSRSDVFLAEVPIQTEGWLRHRH